MNLVTVWNLLHAKKVLVGTVVVFTGEIFRSVFLSCWIGLRFSFFFVKVGWKKALLKKYKFNSHKNRFFNFCVSRSANKKRMKLLIAVFCYKIGSSENVGSVASYPPISRKTPPRNFIFTRILSLPILPKRAVCHFRLL